MARPTPCTTGSGEALQKARSDRGLSIRALAIATGMSTASIRRHIHGGSISAQAAIAYSKVLGVPLSALRADLWPPESGA